MEEATTAVDFLHPPDNDIELDLNHQLLETSENFDLPQISSDYPTSVLEVLIKVGQKTNNNLKQISNQLKRNHDQMEKIEIAVVMLSKTILAESRKQ
jgi:hypothetical protein